MPSDAPTWEETKEVEPQWEDTTDPAPVIDRRQPGVSTIAGGTRGGGLNLQPLTQADLPDANDLGELYQDVSRPAVKLPRFTVDPKGGKVQAVAKSAANLLISLPEFAESPLGIATAGAAGVVPKLVAGAFLADTAKSVVDESKTAGENWDAMTPAEKAATATDLAGGVVLAGVLAHGATRHTPGAAEMLAKELDRTDPQMPAWEDSKPVVEAVAAAKAPVWEETQPPAETVQTPVPGEVPAAELSTLNSQPPTPLVPVEVTENAVNTMKGSVRTERPPDILDTIEEHFPNGVKFDAADHADQLQQAADLKGGTAKTLMSHTDGEPADKVLDGLHLEGLHQGIENVDELASAMVQADQARLGRSDRVSGEARQLAEEQARTKLFDAANLPTRKGVESLPVESLFIGDTFKLNGEPMTVTDFPVDAETGKPFGVELQGAYGKQHVNAGEKIHIDEGSLVDPNAVPQQPGRVAASGTSAPRPQPGAWDVGRYEAAKATHDRTNATPAEKADATRVIQRLERMYPQLTKQGDLFSQARVAAAGGSAPKATTSTAAVKVPPLVATTPAPSSHPLFQWLGNNTSGVRAATAPQTFTPTARGVGNAIRHFMGQNALAMARADESLKSWHKEFDRTPVAKDFHYDPAQPLPHNYAIIDALERDPSKLPARYQDLVRIFGQEFAWRIAEIQKFAPEALQKLIENYFPHIWEDPKRAKGAMAQVASRLFAGRKEFLKQRTLPFFRDGLERGLKPISDNPVDLLMAKMHSMDKMLLALRAQAEFKATGAMRFRYALEKMPDGFVAVDDPAFVIHGPPTVTFKEAFDAQLRTKTLELLQKLGVKNSRLATLGGQRWGLAYESPEQIKTRFGGPEWVYWHELGHILDYRYDLQNTFLKQGKQFDDELRALADRRLPANYPKTKAVYNPALGKTQNRPTAMVKYVRNAQEKMAVMSQAYVHAPEVFRKVAPTVFRQFDQFITDHPELHEIRHIKPSLRLDTAETEHKLPGVLKLGDWIMPEAPAQVITNYLSPGLAHHAAFRTFKSASNILNAAQLGLSGFHLGFTSLDAATSRLAIGIEDLSKGHVTKAAKTFASVPASPVTNILQGRRMVQEALHPGTTDAETAQLVRALEQAGGRIGSDKFYQTDFVRRLKRAWHEGSATGYLKTIPLSALSAVELAMKPIMEYVVPRQKLGVFADMARREIEQLGPNAGVAETREAMRKAWDSVDNRMGQVVYDNLFYNRAVKDLALMSFRAYGWQLGKYREGFGALADTAGAVKDAAQGRRPLLSHRMAYAMALPIMVGTIGATMNYLMTGQRPQDWKDYFMPRTGTMDTNGNAARLHLPSYMKDVIAYAKHPLTSLGHSLNPMFSAITDLVGNKDFYNVQIRNPDDPLWKQGTAVAKFAAQQFIPFSVSGTAKLHEQGSPLQQEILPFFGVTPVPSRITMTPAQELAAEITGANMPSAPRTREQFDRAKLVKEIVQDFRAGQNASGRSALAKGFQTGSLNLNSVQTMMDKLKYTPLQFQVHHMEVPAAMRVWRIANATERTQIHPMLAAKITTSQTLTPDEIKQYTEELGRK